MVWKQKAFLFIQDKSIILFTRDFPRGKKLQPCHLKQIKDFSIQYAVLDSRCLEKVATYPRRLSSAQINAIFADHHGSQMFFGLKEVGFLSGATHLFSLGDSGAKNLLAELISFLPESLKIIPKPRFTELFAQKSKRTVMLASALADNFLRFSVACEDDVLHRVVAGSKDRFFKEYENTLRLWAARGHLEKPTITKFSGVDYLDDQPASNGTPLNGTRLSFEDFTFLHAKVLTLRSISLTRQNQVSNQSLSELPNRSALVLAKHLMTAGTFSALGLILFDTYRYFDHAKEIDSVKAICAQIRPEYVNFSAEHLLVKLNLDPGVQFVSSLSKLGEILGKQKLRELSWTRDGKIRVIPLKNSPLISQTRHEIKTTRSTAGDKTYEIMLPFSHQARGQLDAGSS